jgi:hypothetical protein
MSIDLGALARSSRRPARAPPSLVEEAPAVGERVRRPVEDAHEHARAVERGACASGDIPLGSKFRAPGNRRAGLFFSLRKPSSEAKARASRRLPDAAHACSSRYGGRPGHEPRLRGALHRREPGRPLRPRGRAPQMVRADAGDAARALRPAHRPRSQGTSARTSRTSTRASSSRAARCSASRTTITAPPSPTSRSAARSARPPAQLHASSTSSSA